MSTVQQSHSENAENTTTENKTAEQSPAAEKAASSSRSKKSPGAFRTISEVADELGVQQHVLRFWETKFTQVKPLKRGGGRRYYRPEDVALLQKIHHLLYTEGYTIKGVQKLLKGQGKQQILASDIGEAANEPSAATPQETTPQQQPATGMSSRQKSILQAMLGDLKELRDMLKGEEES